MEATFTVLLIPIKNKSVTSGSKVFQRNFFKVLAFWLHQLTWSIVVYLVNNLLDISLLSIIRGLGQLYKVYKNFTQAPNINRKSTLMDVRNR